MKDPARSTLSDPSSYWEQRAQLFAWRGDSLAAVCSYGMPSIYNRTIELTQRLALRPWLNVPPGTRVLDAGCGVGRWSRALAARGALVTGVDLSRTMVQVARQRATAEGVADRCGFLVKDLADLDLGVRFDLVLGVTVLQHILEPDRFRSAVERLARHLAPHGRMLLLEAAPARDNRRCNSSTFRARPRHAYTALFRQCGLHLEAVRGVDPMPLRVWLLPYQARLGGLRWAANAAVSALSLPMDALLAQRLVARSWHALFVLRSAGAGRAR